MQIAHFSQLLPWAGKVFCCNASPVLMWCLFSAILLPRPDVCCVSLFWLRVFHALLVCTLFLLTPPGRCRGLWAPTHAQRSSKSATDLQVEGRGASSTEQCLRSPGLCPSLPQHICRDKPHPEITCAQAGWSALQSPWCNHLGLLWLRKILLLLAMALIDWSWCILLLGLFQIFLPSAACSALPHKVALAVAGWQKCLAAPNWCKASSFTHYNTQNMTLNCFCCPWSVMEGRTGIRNALNSRNYLFLGEWITAQSYMIRIFWWIRTIWLFGFFWAFQVFEIAILCSLNIIFPWIVYTHTCPIHACMTKQTQLCEIFVLKN